MLEEDFRDMGDRVYIKACQNANRLTVAHFKWKTKTTNILVRELLFEDDQAEEIQRILDGFATASLNVGLKINIKRQKYVPTELYNGQGGEH